MKIEAAAFIPLDSNRGNNSSGEIRRILQFIIFAWVYQFFLQNLS